MLRLTIRGDETEKAANWPPFELVMVSPEFQFELTRFDQALTFYQALRQFLTKKLLFRDLHKD